MLLPPAAGAARIKAKLNATLILYLPRPTRVIAGAQAHSASGRQPAQKFVSGNVPGSESVSSGSGRRAGVCGVRLKSQRCVLVFRTQLTVCFLFDTGYLSIRLGNSPACVLLIGPKS